MIIDTWFDFGQRVYIDGDKSIVARVTAIQNRENYVTVECSYLHNGEAKAAWIELARIGRADDT